MYNSFHRDMIEATAFLDALHEVLSSFFFSTHLDFTSSAHWCSWVRKSCPKGDWSRKQIWKVFIQTTGREYITQTQLIGKWHMKPKSLASIFPLISCLDIQAHWTAHRYPALPFLCCQVIGDFFFLLCIQHQWLSRVTRPSPAEACRPHSSGDYIHPSRREGRDAGQKEWASSGEGGVEGSKEGVSNREHPNEHRQELEDSTAGKGEGKQSYTLLYKKGQQGIRLICCGAWKWTHYSHISALIPVLPANLQHLTRNVSAHSSDMHI